jgi:hypothetical protein
LGNGRVAGSLKHGYAKRLLDRYQLMYGQRGLTTEVRYLNKIEWKPGMGLQDTIRLDVVEGPLNGPTAVWDYKFGVQGLTPARISQIRAGAPLSSTTPILEVRP